MVCREIKSRSLTITNQKALDILSKHQPWSGKILDMGAGEGYFTALAAEELIKHGCPSLKEQLFACDFFPEEFKFAKIQAAFCDFNSDLPYEDNTFDAVCSIEVIEHLENIFHFTREIHRILKPGGVAVITTPNVLNINSRLRHFFTGFPSLYNPLPISFRDLQNLGGHINPVSYYFLVYAASKAGFREVKLCIDRLKKSAGFLTLLFYFPIRIFEKLIFYRYRKTNKGTYEENKQIIRAINSIPLLLSRTVIIEAVK